MSWKTRELINEGTANLRGSAFRSILLAAICAAAFGGLAFAEVRQAADLSAFAASYREAGAHIAVVSLQGDGIPGSRCEALRWEQGVIGAGAWRSAGQVSFASAPGVLFQAADVTPGILAVWSPGERFYSGAGVIAGMALAEETGLRRGLMVRFLENEPMVVTGVAELAPRMPQATRWVLGPVSPSGFFDECWVEFEPGVSEAGKASLAAIFATGAADPVVRSVRRSDEFTRDPAAEWESRPQKHGWVAVTIALSGFIVAAAWYRRSEAALYMATGTGRLELVVMSAAEHWPIVALGWCIGYSYAVSAHLSWGEGAAMDFARHAAVTSGAAAILLLPASACANALIARGNIAALLKDR